MNWIEEIPEQHKRSIEKSLEIVKKFPGLVAVTGSSSNERFPIGRDIDLALVGLSKHSGLEYTRKLAIEIYEEYLSNLRNISLERDISELDYPLIKEVRFDLEDPLISTCQEMIPGHGGSNISLEILPYPLGELRFEEDYLTEYRSKAIGPNRTLIDLIIDYSLNVGDDLHNNVNHWKRTMEKIGKKYFILRD